MTSYAFCTKPKFVPALDPGFRPASLELRDFSRAVAESGGGIPLAIAVERNDGLTSVYSTHIFAEDHPLAGANYFYVERLVKTLLWQRGGWKVTIGGSAVIGQAILEAYSGNGARAFDAKFMSRVYEKPFTVEVTELSQMPKDNEISKPVGRHLDGCRIGFDAGGSDRKVSAVIDGEAVYSEEVVWHPKTQSDPRYHYDGILTAMKTAASHMPRVDAIGVSSAGVYVNNRVMVASLFLKVPEADFNREVKDLFLKIQKEFGNVPMEVANDGDVSALAGAMDLNDTNVLGMAMGTSQAAGYVDGSGNITGWLNELCFVPVDYNPEAMVDEWSGDYGCGVKYFSQDGVNKLASAAGVAFEADATPAEKLKVVQKLFDSGDSRAIQVFESMGCYLGYGIGLYAELYDIKHIVILGRVTSGEAGNLMLAKAKEVLEGEFPETASKIRVHLPDEASRRVGQSIAAASLPEIK